MKIVVIGGSGVLGGMICSELNHLYERKIRLYIGDYKRDRGVNTAKKYNAKFCETNINDADILSKALADMDLVIVAMNQKEPLIQMICKNMAIKCVDVTASYTFVKQVEKLFYNNKNDGEATSLLMAGYFPGLSGLLLQSAVKTFDSVEDAKVSLIQSTNAKAGVSGIIDMLKIISENIVTLDGEKEVSQPGFHIKRRVHLPNHDKGYEVRQISHSEKKLMDDTIGIKNLTYWTAWNQSYFNSVIGFLKSTGLLNYIINKVKPETLNKYVKHDEGKNEESMLIVELQGYKEGVISKKTYVIKVGSDYGTTAKVVAALSKLVLEKDNKGVCLPLHLSNLDEILGIISSEDINYITY